MEVDVVSLSVPCVVLCVQVVQTLQFGEPPERALVDVLREAVPPRQDMDDMTEAMAVDLLGK